MAEESAADEPESSVTSTASATTQVSTTPSAKQTGTTLAPKTAVSTTSTAKPMSSAAVKPPVVPTPVTAAQTTTTARYVPPQTTAGTTTTASGNPWFVPAESSNALPVVRGAQECEVQGSEYIAQVLAGQTKQRAEHELPPMTIDPDLTAYAQAHAMRMAQEARNFHSEKPPGGEATGYYNYVSNTPDIIGELLTTHVHNFLEAEYVKTGIGAVKCGSYVYVVMLCHQ